MSNRNVKHNQSEEDYLESILLLTEGEGFVHRIEIAKKMGVSQAAVNKAVKLLQEKNYVYEDGKHLYLTEEGKAQALAVFERHCILREFFLSLGVSPENAEADACNMEHLLSDETFEVMKRKLGKE